MGIHKRAMHANNSKLHISAILVAIYVSLLFGFYNIKMVYADEFVACRGDEITITARLLQNGSYGEPVPFQDVYFFDQTYNTFLGTSSTDINGYANLDWQIPIDHPLGSIIINVTFNGNQSLFLAPVSQLVQLTIISSTLMEINIRNQTASPGDSLSFVILLLDDTSSIIANGLVSVFCRDTLLAVGRTNNSGLLTLKLHCNDSWYQLGDNQIMVVFERDMTLFFDEVKKSFTIDIKQIETHLASTGFLGSNITLNQTLQKIVTARTDEGYLVDSELEVSVDGLLLDLIRTNNTGAAKLLLHIDNRFTIGSHKLEIKYLGTERYASSLLEIDFIITTPTFVNISLPEYIILNTYADFKIVLTDTLNRPIPRVIVTLTDPISNQEISKLGTTNQTSYLFSLLILGSRGHRDIVLNITDNPYLTNQTLKIEVVVWIRPQLFVKESSIMGYSSPQQEIMIKVRLSDHEANYSNRILEITDKNGTLSSSTDKYGNAYFFLTAPETEGYYEFIIAYFGLTQNYELAVTMNFNFQVIKKMPIRIEMENYVVCTPLQEIVANLILQCLNGTNPKGVRIDYEWQSHHGTVVSQSNGKIQMHLLVPATAGIHSLYYLCKESHSLSSCSGRFLIHINHLDVSAAEGVGIAPMIASLFSSIGIGLIPALRRRYMIG